MTDPGPPGDPPGPAPLPLSSALDPFWGVFPFSRRFSWAGAQPRVFSLGFLGRFPGIFALPKYLGFKPNPPCSTRMGLYFSTEKKTKKTSAPADFLGTNPSFLLIINEFKSQETSSGWSSNLWHGLNFPFSPSS